VQATTCRRYEPRQGTRPVCLTAHAWTYTGTRKRCGPCALRPQLHEYGFPVFGHSPHEPARQRARELANAPDFARAQRQRKKVEALFAELKNQTGLRRLRLRGLKFLREQFLMAAAVQNIKRLVRFLSPRQHHSLASARKERKNSVALLPACTRPVQALSFSSRRGLHSSPLLSLSPFETSLR
jgi:Transposase DDE domain